jgi:hypothetical protein
LTGLFCGSKLGRGFAWVFSAIIGWSGMGIFIAAGEDVSALQTTVALTLVVLGQVMGVVLVKRVRGFAERSRRHAGRAVGLSIAVGAVVVSCSLLAITRTEDQMTNFVSRAFGLVWLTATLAGVLAALSGAESRAAAPASAAVRCGGTDATETAGHDA